MSIRLVVTRGYGNGTFLGSIKDVTTRGYIGAAIAGVTAAALRTVRLGIRVGL